MNLKFDFGCDVLVLPGRLGPLLHNADGTALKVLVALASCSGADYKTLAEMADCSPQEAENAVKMWLEQGILVQDGERVTDSTTAQGKDAESQSDVAARKPAKGKPARHDKLPQYTTEELTDLLEKRQDTAALLDECQKVWGKMFNTHEVNIILGLVDYLGLEWEYVLSLLAYCQGLETKRGMRRSLHYVESMAFSFYDEGVCTVQALYEKLRRLDEMAEVEGQLRTLFGMGDRALTPQEKKYFSAWIHEFGYGMDVIRKAYDITVDTKGTPKMSYMNSILANWNRDGLRTLPEIEAAQTAFNEAREKECGTGKGKGKNPAASAGQGTFDTEDFFEAAVRRSLGDDFDPTILKPTKK